MVKYEVNKTLLCFVLLWRIQIILIHSWSPLAPLGHTPLAFPLVGGRVECNHEWRKPTQGMSGACYQGNSGSVCWRPLGRGIEHASALSYLKGKEGKTHIRRFPLSFGEGPPRALTPILPCVWSGHTPETRGSPQTVSGCCLPSEATNL